MMFRIDDSGRLIRRFAWGCFCPVMRPMFYDFPEDAACWNLEKQYMFGPDYLVAPVMEPGVDTMEIYLPAGKWLNIDTGEMLEGGRWVSVPAPLDIIPVMKRM